jgi:hypothetical protein
MKPKTASKWIIGVSGVVLSTFFISQIQDDSHSDWNNPTSMQQEQEITVEEDYNLLPDDQLLEREEEPEDLEVEEFDSTTITKETEDEQRRADARSRRS